MKPGFSLTNPNMRSIFEILSSVVCCCITLFATCAGCGGERLPVTPEEKSTVTKIDELEEKKGGSTAQTGDSQPAIQVARKALEQEKLDVAEESIREHLLTHPDDPEGLFLAATVAAAKGDHREAAELLDKIPTEHPQAGLAALGQSADWMIMGGQWAEAESRYKKLLRLAPNAAIAHRRLAYLFNRQGRREEASRHVLQLCLAGNVTQAELHTLINQCEAVFEEGLDNTPGTFSPIGALAHARIAFSNDNFKKAIDILVAANDEGELHDYGFAFLGRLATEVDDPDSVEIWLSNLSPEQQEFGDYWVARGNQAIKNGEKADLAARCFAEAILRNPTDWVAVAKFETCLDRLGRKQDVLRCRDRVLAIKKTIRIHSKIVQAKEVEPSDIAALCETLERLHRPLESTMWQAIALSGQPNAGAAMELLNRRRKELVANGQYTTKAVNALNGVDVADLPDVNFHDLPRMPSEATKASRIQYARAVHPAFVDVALDAGIRFQYLNGPNPILADTQLYQQFGGGAAAFDFDQDGRVDVYFNQGGDDPKRDNRGQSNHLYRGIGTRFERVLEVGADNQGYGQGVTSGDWNQDGFPDLVLANFGANTILVNNGDGTFSPIDTETMTGQTFWSTSVALADVNDDSLPDLVEINYVDDPAIHEVPAKGPNGRFVSSRGPESYRPAGDRVIFQHADGSSKTIDLGKESNRAHGLGVLITDVDSRGKNEIFVANDTDANQLWFQPGDWSQSANFRDAAGLRGCAYSSVGGSGASMGIATGDFDGNGQLDFHVTNFLHEPVHVYLQDLDNNFFDAVIKTDLHRSSVRVLGFGTQAIDFDNNSTVDLAVLNGHIDDLRYKGADHKMLPQLFSGSVGSFKALEFDHSASYWRRPSIGRGLLRLDWNRDGKMDLLATHHDAPAALLENRTSTKYAWLQFRLVGTASERTSIGARVEIQTDSSQFVEFVTAGDGYACKNEAILSFGLGDAAQLANVIVQWPSGATQTFSVPTLNRRYLLVEGQASVYSEN